MYTTLIKEVIAKKGRKVEQKLPTQLVQLQGCSDNLVCLKSSSNEDKTDCLVFGNNFDDNWIRCKICEGWLHKLCAVEDTLYYYCDYCTNYN